jgi:hypothetical protein
MSYIKVEGHSGLVRDKETGAILNINKTEVEQARERKKLRKQKEQELQDLKNDVSEMKQLLAQLVEKYNGSNER